MSSEDDEDGGGDGGGAGEGAGGASGGAAGALFGIGAAGGAGSAAGAAGGSSAPVGEDSVSVKNADTRDRRGQSLVARLMEYDRYGLR